MTNKNKHELEAFLRSAQARMKEDYERFTLHSAEDPNTAGAQGEGSWKKFFESWLPPTFSILTGCRLIGHNGQRSKQVDVVVLRPEYPKNLIDEKYILTGGVLAAFECKLTLRSRDIKAFFERSHSVKVTANARLGTPYRELQRPILYGLLAHSHGWGVKSNLTSALNDKIHKIDTEKVDHPSMMPDLICIADLATWSAIKFIFPPGHPMGGGPRKFPTIKTGYSLHGNEMYPVHPLGALISALWLKLAYEYPTLGSMAEYFQETGIQGIGNGPTRWWSHDVLSTRVKDYTQKGALNNIMGDQWSMWIH